MKTISFAFLFGFIACLSARADWRVAQGSLDYTVKHLFKTVHGKTQEVKGLIRCEQAACNVLVAAPLQSFNSENASRDTHMQQVMKAAEFPMVQVHAHSVNTTPGKHTETVTVEVAGKNHDYAIETEVKKIGNDIEVISEVPFKLTDFNLERPSLLGAAIDDFVPIHVELTFSKKN